MKILILCTGNSCRSQMAQGILQAFDKNIEVYSAGTNPAEIIHPKAVIMLNELGLDISNHYPKNADEYLNEEWDFVITVCDGAKETCPVFLGKVKNRVHMGFEDPADATGTEDEIMNKFRKIRDEILRDFFTFYNKNIR